MTETTRAVYDERWRAVRLRILERDGYVCQIRGPLCEGRANEVDHIIPWRQGGAVYDPSNLRAACKRCNGGRVFRAIGDRRPSREW